MRNLAVKTQSIWFLSYFMGLVLAMTALLQVFDFLIIKNIDFDQTLLLSGLLFALGAGLGLGSLESNERNLFWKWKYAWIVLMFLGLILTFSGIISSFTNSNIIGTDWRVTFFIGFPFLVYSLILLFSGMNTGQRESASKMWPLFALFLVIGVITGMIGFFLFFLSTGGSKTIAPVSWDQMLALGSVFGALSIIPYGYIMGSNESTKGKFHKLWPLWLLFSVAGLIILILSIIEIISVALGGLDVVDQYLAIGGQSHREAGLLLGIVFQAPGFVFLFASTDKNELIAKLNPVWFLLVFLGLIFGLLPFFASNYSTLGVGLAITIVGAGSFFKGISIDYVEGQTGSATSRTTSSSSSQSSAIAGKVAFDIPSELPAEEKIFLVELQRKTNENTIQLLTNSAKQNKLSKDYVNKKINELTIAIKDADAQITSIREQAKRSSRASIFESAMGTEAQTSAVQTPPPQKTTPSPMSAPTPAAPPMSAPTPTPPPMSAPTPPPMSTPAAPPMSSGPPMPPKPPGAGPSMPPPMSSGPPMPPKPPGAGPSMPPPPGGSMPPPPPGGSMPPPPPGGSMPPKPPGMPPMPGASPPPMPGAAPAPKPPGAPGAPAPSGDAVGTQRSTSIAELRGEMLKELRRLRDIFNEEGK